MNVKYILAVSLLALFLLLAYVLTFFEPKVEEDIKYNYKTNDFDVKIDPTIRFGEETTLAYKVATEDK